MMHGFTWGFCKSKEGYRRAPAEMGKVNSEASYIYVLKKKKHFGNGERDRKGAPLRRHPFNVRVPGGTKAGVTRVSDLVSIPHKEDWE